MEKQEYVDNHRKMWDRVITKISEGYSGLLPLIKEQIFNEFWPDISITANCWGCAYAEDHGSPNDCKNCLFKSNNTDSGFCLDGTYSNLVFYLGNYQMDEALELAKKIRDWPIIEDKKCTACGLEYTGKECPNGCHSSNRNGIVMI